MVKTFSKAALAEQGSRLELSSPQLFSPSRFLSTPPPPLSLFAQEVSRMKEDEGVFDSPSLYLRRYPSPVQLADVESFIRPPTPAQSSVCCSAEEGASTRGVV